MRPTKYLSLATFAVAFLLAACGGGGGGGSTGSLPLMVDSLGRTVQEADFGNGDSGAEGADGSAGDGAPIANAAVTLIDNAGHTVATTTDATGYYRVSVKGFTPPFVAKVVRSNGTLWYSPSVAPIKPRGFVTVNITGLTDQVGSNLASSLSLSGGAAAITPAVLSSNSALLATVKTNLVDQLAASLISVGLNPKTFDPITTPYQAVVTDNYDKLIESIAITKDPITGTTVTVPKVSVTAAIQRDMHLDVPGTGEYKSGLNIYIAVNNTTYDSALVVGPGLPTLGLWYFYQSNTPYNLVLAAQRSANPPGSLTPSCSSCMTFRMVKTQGLTGSAAAAYGTNSTQMNWAQPGEGAYNGASGTKPLKGSVYTFTFYKNSAAVQTVSTALVTDLIDPVQGPNLQWADLGTNSTAFMNPTNGSLNGALASATIDWVPNSAESIKGIWVSMADGGYDNYTPFTVGSTSVVATPASGTTFTTLTGTPSYNSPYSGYREIGLKHLMLDGSTKVSDFRYN